MFLLHGYYSDHSRPRLLVVVGQCIYRRIQLTGQYTRRRRSGLLITKVEDEERRRRRRNYQGVEGPLVNGGRSISYNKKEGYIYIYTYIRAVGKRGAEGTHLMFARINKKEEEEEEEEEGGDGISSWSFYHARRSQDESGASKKPRSKRATEKETERLWLSAFVRTITP